jgi:predicted Zn-dependent protease
MKAITLSFLIGAAVFTILAGCEHIAAVGAFGAGLAGDAGLIDKGLADGLKAGLGTFAESAKAAKELTPENEYYIGRAVAANITTQYKVDTGNKNLQTYLNKICSSIVVNSPRPEIFNGYHVAILDSTEINAFATSGGHIFITKGLIACTSTEDQLASVIAHEIAHIQLQHGLTAIRNSRYLDAVMSGAIAGISAGAGSDIGELANVLGDSVGEIMITMVNNGYAKDQEFEADNTALSLLKSSGYEPSAIVGMLHSLEKNEVKGSGFGKTHPAPKDRISKVEANIKKYTVPDTQPYRKERYTLVSK